MSPLLPKELSRLWDRFRNRADQLQFERSSWYAGDDRSEDDGVFVLGCGRSGTTLLREMICRHSAFGGGPETLFFVKTLDLEYLRVITDVPLAELQALRDRSGSIVAFAQEYYRAQAAREGKRRWVDKTPMHVRALPRILRGFPNARVVHLIRDGRDVACSLRHHPKQRVEGGRIVPNEVDRPISECAGRWVRDVSAGRALSGHPRLRELRYEELVADPEGCLRPLCEFLGEPFESGMLVPGGGERAGVLMNNANAAEAVSTARLARWKRDLSPEELRVVDRIAGALLLALGYVDDPGWAEVHS